MRGSRVHLEANGIGAVVLTMKVKKMIGFIGKRGVLTASRFFSV